MTNTSKHHMPSFSESVDVQMHISTCIWLFVCIQEVIWTQFPLTLNDSLLQSFQSVEQTAHSVLSHSVDTVQRLSQLD